jgi:aryl-alcohol dehydrogenase-like predicted oxidoreductase
METRRLGHTPLVVSRLGLGLAALGRPGYINLGHADDLGHSYDHATMQGHAHAVLDAAFAGGIRYFDAARSYGDAEAFLASWLADRGIPPDAVTVGSKWGYTYTADWQVHAAKHEVKDHSLAVLQRQTAESQRLLGRYLRLYQIHSATLDSGVLDNRDVLDELARLRRGGLAIGLSLTGPRQAETLRRALEIRAGGERLFDCVQATWNLLEPSASHVLQDAHDAGLGVLVKEALANGRLSVRNTDPTFAERRRLLESTAAGFGTTPDAVALAAVLAQPWADVILSGIATVDHLVSNLAALNCHCDKTTLDSLRSLAEPAGQYWQTRAGLPWN